MSHKVKTHFWENGILRTISNAFESLEEALGFVNKSNAHAAKVYDDSGSLVYSAQNVNPEPPVTATETETYA